MNQILFVGLLSLLSLSISPLAHAEKADRNQGTTLSATKRLVVNDQTRTQVLEGEAELSRGTIKISAERLEFHQDSGGNQFAILH